MIVNMGASPLALSFGMGLSLLTAAQNVLTDPGTFGPALEIAHLYYGQWPTGVAVSDSGRMFSSYPAGLDANNTNNGRNEKYAVAELRPGNTEVPYPSAEYNTPPGGAIDYSMTPPTGKADMNHFLGVQSVIVDSNNTLWILDTGRAVDPATGALVTAKNPGGTKLVAIDLATNRVIRTITFPPTVAYPDSYFNDVRVDLRPNLSGANSSGVAYIVDSSGESRNGIVVVDIGSGNSWRHFDHDPRVHVTQQFVPFVYGQPVYGYTAATGNADYLAFGVDGMTLSADGETLYFNVLSDRYLRSVPAAILRMQDAKSEIRCEANVRTLTQKGVSDGFETDSNGNIYMGQIEASSIIIWNEEASQVELFVRDPRINWVDTMSVAGNSLYFTVNQLQSTPNTYPGTDRRQPPYVLFKTPLPNGGKKVMLGGDASNSTFTNSSTHYKW